MISESKRCERARDPHCTNCCTVESTSSDGSRVQMFNARWVDDQQKEKSRYVVKDFANTRDPTMLAAASDTAVGRVVEFKAVIQNYSMFTFDVAHTHA